MDYNQLVAILVSSINTTASVADRLVYSIRKSRKNRLDPLTMAKLESLSDDDMECIDAYLFRYGSLVSNIQGGIFKSIFAVEQESIDISNRDKTNLMERFGALSSAEEFSSLAIIRNKLMHDYPEEMQKHLDRINFIMTEASRLVEIFLGIVKYAEKFGISPSFDGLHHLSSFINDLTLICVFCHKTPCECGGNGGQTKPGKLRMG